MTDTRPSVILDMVLFNISTNTTLQNSTRLRSSLVLLFINPLKAINLKKHSSALYADTLIVKATLKGVVFFKT